MAWLVVVIVRGAEAATLVGGDYAGADLVPADGDVLEGTFTNVGTFHVPAAARVRVQDRVPLVVEADTILVEGILDGNAAGRTGGLPLGDGHGPGGGVYGRLDDAPGGAGHGGRGGDGGQWDQQCPYGGSRQGGRIYGTHDDAFSAALGSGGGSADCGKLGENDPHGGDGGGSITLRANDIVIAVTGGLTVAGEEGQDYGVSGQDCRGFPFPYGGPGSGGGSGGSLVLDASVSVEIEGRLVARGGDGGAGRITKYDAPGGGGGAGGRIKIYGPLVGDLTRPDVEGGAGGSGSDEGDECGEADPGQWGTVYIDEWVAGPPSLTVAGACGSTTITVSGGTPFGQLLLMTAGSAGSDVLPPRPLCEGLPTGLAGLTKLGVRMLDDAGSWSWVTNGHDARCGGLLQVVDLWSCTTSAVVTLP